MRLKKTQLLQSPLPSPCWLLNRWQCSGECQPMNSSSRLLGEVKWVCEQRIERVFDQRGGGNFQNVAKININKSDER